MISSLTSFAESFGASAGIVAVLSVLVIVGLLAGVYQEIKLARAARKRRQESANHQIEEERRAILNREAP
jgi:hypothetical protein